MTYEQKKQKLSDLQFKINARRLQLKYAKNTLEVISLTMLSVFDMIQYAKIKRQRTEGLAIVGNNNDLEYVIDPNSDNT